MALRRFLNDLTRQFPKRADTSLVDRLARARIDAVVGTKRKAVSGRLRVDAAALAGCDDQIEQLSEVCPRAPEWHALNHKLIAELDAAFARSIPVADQERAAPLFLDLLLVWRGSHVDRENRREGFYGRPLEQAVAGLGGEARGLLFDCLCLIDATVGWDNRAASILRDIVPSGASELEVFPRFMETLRSHVIKIGFPVNQGRASTLIALLGRNAAPVSLTASYDSVYRQKALAILKDVAKAAQKGTIVLSSEDRANGRKMLALAFTDHSGRKVNSLHLQDNVFIKALRTIAGADEQDSFFERMSAIAPSRLPSIALDAGWQELAPIYDSALQEACEICAEVTAYRDGLSPPDTWIKNEASFRRRFGQSVANDPSTVFGWWHRNTKGEQGFSPYVNNRLHGFLDGDFDSLKISLTPEAAANYRQMIVEQAPGWPSRFDAKGLACVDLFTLDGADPEGALLNQLASLGTGKPTAKWRKSTTALITQLGSEKVLDGFNRWLGEFFRTEVPDIPDHLLKNMSTQMSAFRAYKPSGIRTLRPELDAALAMQGEAREQKISLIALLMAGGVHRETHDWSEDSELGRVSRNRPEELKRELSDNNDLVLRAVIYALLNYDHDTSIPLVDRIADTLMDGAWGKIRSKKALSACLWMLGQIGTEPAAHAIGRIRRKARDKTIIKQADKALVELGKVLDMPVDEMLEMAMSDHGIGMDGRRIVEAEGYRVELRVTASNKAVLSTTDPDGKTVRGVAKKFKAVEGAVEIATELEGAVKDIVKILPEARHRIEASWRDGRVWRFASWKRLLAGNGLLHTLVSKLIWVIETADGPRPVLWRDGAWTDVDGGHVDEPAAKSTVSLWHPLEASANETDAWRKRLSALGIRQPFAQAWRPVYVLTEAERQTETYSNRFAAHVLEQAPVMAMLKKRGWIAYNRTMQGNSAAHERVQMLLPHFGVTAQFWIAGVGNRIQDGKAADEGAELYAFVRTDRLCFFELDAESGQPTERPVRMADVPERALCEAMYDVDHVVGRTSIGADRHWRDRGAFAGYPVNEQTQFESYRNRYAAGATSGLAKSRREALHAIVPALSIADQLQLAEDYLIVNGKLKTYKIHYGSGHILIAPNDQYLCIVRSSKEEPDAALPYEGDHILSLIVSKAFLLAADDEINDATILTQIGR